MYKAINNFVIVEKVEDEQVSASGIVDPTKIAETYKVVSTTEVTKELDGKTIMFSESTELTQGFLSVDYNNVVAIYE